MTVEQLIKKLQTFDPKMQVVVRTDSKNFTDDFTDLNVSDLAIVTTAKLYNDPYWGKQIYDASYDSSRPRNFDVLSLSGPTTIDKIRSR